MKVKLARICLVVGSLCVCLVGLTSCAGDGEGLTESGDPVSPQARATLGPEKDNTLYESSTGALSNGAGEYFFAGKTTQGALRRGVIAFDIAGNLPAGARVTSVSLTLHESREPSAGGPEVIELYQILSAWGEGVSDAPANEGAGAAATPGDATWTHTFSDTGFWANAGGDFSQTVSASQTVDGIGFYSWSSSRMVADVQSWLDTPGDNFGWIVVGNEGPTGTAKRFDTRENNVDLSFRPELRVEYAR